MGNFTTGKRKWRREVKEGNEDGRLRGGAVSLSPTLLGDRNQSAFVHKGQSSNSGKSLICFIILMAMAEKQAPTSPSSSPSAPPPSTLSTYGQARRYLIAPFAIFVAVATGLSAGTPDIHQYMNIRRWREVEGGGGRWMEVVDGVGNPSASRLLPPSLLSLLFQYSSF